jgi:hypothetical protein
LQKQRTSGTYEFSPQGPGENMIVQFSASFFFKNESARPHAKRKLESDEESILTLISVTIRSLIFFVCAVEWFLG